ncbi:unnamed protein product [Strongylus vulgaris]|uniref:Uncharacterized protein n=1 Tax=Strongylus vulgaris TaxID=40348 RepID=A0A3P7I564_STRVU|nr:unnamed protein product [Strongylus vulgaris]
MDATTACHLMSDPFAGHNYAYSIPIRVVQKLVQGTMTNVAVVGKPRILEIVDRATIQRYFVKYIVKSQFIHKKGKTYSIFSVIGTSFLVRSRPPPLCSEGHQSMKGKTLSFQPRLEYVPNAGAMV